MAGADLGLNSVGDMFQAELDDATPQKKLAFDLSGIDDESFWDGAEQLILNALSEYADEAESNADQKRLFAEDAAKGFAFIDLCRKRFDIALMNPPFGLPVDSVFPYMKKHYKNAYVDIYASFVQRCFQVLNDGFLGAITSRAFLTTKKLDRWREHDLCRHMGLLYDLGLGVMDDAFVESCAYVLSTKTIDSIRVFDKRGSSDKKLMEAEISSVKDKQYFVKNDYFRLLPGTKFLYSLPINVFYLMNSPTKLEPDIATARQGLCTFDDFRFLRLSWELQEDQKSQGAWEPLAKGGEYAIYFSELPLLVNRRKNASELAEINIQTNGQTAQSRQASDYYYRAGGTYSKRSAKGFSVRALPEGCVIATKGPAVISESNVPASYLVGWLNSRLITFLVQLQANAAEFNTGIVKQLPWINDSDEQAFARRTEDVASLLKEVSSKREESLYFSGLPGGNSIHEMYGEFSKYAKHAIEQAQLLLRDWNSHIDLIYGIDSLSLEQEVFRGRVFT